MTAATYNVWAPWRAAQAAPRLPEGAFGRWDLTRDTDLSCDVVIVGSGAGGGPMAAELAEAGLDVVIVEEGSYHATETFKPDVSDGIRRLYREMGTTMALGAPPVLYQEGCTVGGSTVINGGMSWRTPEHILTQWSREHGVAHISPDAMDPYYERVERRINVAYQDPESVGRDNAMFKQGADAQGWNVIPNLRNQAHCAGTNNCAFGCPTGAKRSVLVTYIPRALHFGARLLSDVRVERILRRGKRAEGVVGRVVLANGKPGPRVEVRAKLVVSACGAIHTPALLHRSGFRSPSGQLGRNLWLHPNSKVVAVFDEDVRGWEGVHQAYQIREFGAEGILMAAVNLPPGIVAMTVPYYGAQMGELLQDYPKMLVAGLLMEDSRPGRVVMLPGGKPLPLYQVTDADAAKLQWGVVKLCELLLDMGARKIILPFAEVPPIHNGDDLDRLRAWRVRKKSMEVVTVHLMGTARMGPDRATSVTDSFGFVHDADRLMVSDASLFPGPIGVNPAETIQSLATRNAAYILDHRARILA